MCFYATSRFTRSPEYVYVYPPMSFSSTRPLERNAIFLIADLVPHSGNHLPQLIRMSDFLPVPYCNSSLSASPITPSPRPSRHSYSLGKSTTLASSPPTLGFILARPAPPANATFVAVSVRPGKRRMRRTWLAIPHIHALIH